MEERKLNEKESLELIAQMIQNSKKNLQVGRGNQFILWGWLGAITSLVVMGMLMLTNNPMWNWVWFAIPLIGWPVMMWQLKKEEKPVITFIDKVMKAVWTTIGSIYPADGIRSSQHPLDNPLHHFANRNRFSNIRSRIRQQTHPKLGIGYIRICNDCIIKDCL